jgi:hypothetical protein
MENQVSIVLDPIINNEKQKKKQLVTFTDYVVHLYGENWFPENQPKIEK